MAGSWGSLIYRNGYLDNAFVPLKGLEKEFTADAAAATISVEPITGVSGWLCGVDIVFDAVAPPNALSLAVQTVDGIQIAVTSAALTASGRLVVEPPVPFAGGLKLVPTGNTTNSAKGKIILLVSPA